MGEKWAFRLAVIAAIAMLGVTTLLTIAAPPCHPLPMSTILAFELARSVEDLQLIFGQPGEACRAALVPQVDQLNTIDIIGYIPTYTLFYGLTAYALGRRDRALGWLTVAIAIVSGLADVAENTALFSLSAAPDAPSPWIPALIVATHIKWVGLAVVTALCGLMLARRGGLGWVLGIACALPLVPAIWAVISPAGGGPYMMPAMVIASVALLGVGIVGAVRRQQAAQVAA